MKVIHKILYLQMSIMIIGFEKVKKVSNFESEPKYF